jgi:hypothetical protein
MSNKTMQTRRYNPAAGENIEETAEQMVSTARRYKCRVLATFNEVGLIASPNSEPGDITTFFHAECENRRAAYEASPEGIAAKRRQEEANRQAAAAETEGILPFTISDKTIWQSWIEANKDGYGAACMRYAARWANLMEAYLAKGKRLEQIAAKASHEADKEGITGFMYGCAVGMLSKAWIHGEALRRWHNLDTQIRAEGEAANKSGGVLNPAMLTLGT